MRKIKKYFCKHLEIVDKEFTRMPYFDPNPIFIRNCKDCGKYLGNYIGQRFLDFGENCQNTVTSDNILKIKCMKSYQNSVGEPTSIFDEYSEHVKTCKDCQDVLDAIYTSTINNSLINLFGL